MFIVATVLLILLDQFSKYLVSTSLPLEGSGIRLGFGFYLTHVHNSGAAFGMLPNGTLALGVLSALVSLTILVYLLRFAATMPAIQRFALTLILAGALGNMIDRFRLGYVIDFIHFKLPNFNFPVFNLADSCVVMGASLLILSSLFKPRRQTVQEIQSDLGASAFENPNRVGETEKELTSKTVLPSGQ
jgi:signal peptidase II